MIRDLAELVAIPSVQEEAKADMPFGQGPADALSCILNMADRMGLVTRNVGNYAGHAEYGEGEETACTITHVDVVPAGGGWNTDPFVLTRIGDRLYGRGTADDKGAAIVALYCLKILKEEQVAGKRKIRAVFGAGEETASNDLKMYFSQEPYPVFAFTPDAEYGICNREKGMLRIAFSAPMDASHLISFHAGTVVNAVPARAEAELRCTAEQRNRLMVLAETVPGQFAVEETTGGVKITSIGKAAHAMQPQEGFNAASALLRLLFAVFTERELGTLASFLWKRIKMEFDGSTMGIKQCDGQSGPLTLNLGIVDITAEQARAKIDIRYPVTAKGEPLIRQIAEAAQENAVDMELIGHLEPLYLPEASPLISLLKSAYREVTGESCALYSTGGGTYAREVNGRAVAFGPFFPGETERNLHNANENIEIKKFMLHAQICLEAMYRMFTE